MVFWDASALVKAYIQEPGTPIVHSVVKRSSGKSVTTDFVALEVLSTFGRRFRSSDLRREGYLHARSEFLKDYGRGFEVLDVTPEVVESAMELADRHRAIGAGAMDLLHVASALRVAAGLRIGPVVASSDAGFLRLADACGLRTFDPETEPLGALLAVWR